MPEDSRTAHILDTVPASGPAERAASHARRLPRGLRGFRRRDVEDLLVELELRLEGLEQQSEELREQLQGSQHAESETRHDLSRARAELRYWNDRASYIDSEVARARQRASQLEREARERADAIEADAQERSLQLVDRVCNEANAMLQAARAEAREMFLRFETDVEMSQDRLTQLDKVRTEVATTMQGALVQFEHAVRQLDEVGPIRRIVEALEEPQRPAHPTFGTQRALDAARRFELSLDEGDETALASPLATSGETPPADGDAHDATEHSNDPEDHAEVLPLSEGGEALVAAFDVQDMQQIVPPPRVSTSTRPSSRFERRAHPADEAFAELLNG